MDTDGNLAALKKYEQRLEMSEEVSNCCGEPIYEDSDICSKCREHCEPISLGEHLYELYLQSEEDKADAKRDER